MGAALGVAEPPGQVWVSLEVGVVGDRDSWWKGGEGLGDTTGSFRKPSPAPPTSPPSAPPGPSYQRAQEAAGKHHGPGCIQTRGPRVGAGWSAGSRCPPALPGDLWGPTPPNTDQPQSWPRNKLPLFTQSLVALRDQRDVCEEGDSFAGSQEGWGGALAEPHTLTSEETQALVWFGFMEAPSLFMLGSHWESQWLAGRGVCVRVHVCVCVYTCVHVKSTWGSSWLSGNEFD